MISKPTPRAGSASRARAGAGSERPPGCWSSRTVRLAARALPGGADRDRYRQEFLAELHGLGRSRQWRHALAVLVRSHALRSAIAARAPIPTETAMIVKSPSKPLLCRTNVHHKWVQKWTTDGHRYMCCARCGKDRTEYDDGNFSSTGKVAGAALAQLGLGGGMGGGGGAG